MRNLVAALVNRRLIAIYLNDHMAASTGAVELVRRVAVSNRGTSHGEMLAELKTEIEQDRAALASIMDRLEIRIDPARKAIAWGAEKLGRLKLNGQLTGYSPLSRLEELEILELGVTGQHMLWETLRRVRPPAVSEEELERLSVRARGQRERLERHRLEAAAEALGEAEPSATST
jgi:hypothetical protein